MKRDCHLSLLAKSASLPEVIYIHELAVYGWSIQPTQHIVCNIELYCSWDRVHRTWKAVLQWASELFFFKGWRSTYTLPVDLQVVCLNVSQWESTLSMMNMEESGTLDRREASLRMQSSPSICVANNAPTVYIIGLRGLMYFLTGMLHIS